MKNKKFFQKIGWVLLLIFTFCFLFVFHSYVHKIDETKEVRPLVLDYSGIQPGIYDTTIVLSGEGTVSKIYEGAANIRMDGDTLLITCDDDIRNTYAEEEK